MVIQKKVWQEEQKKHLARQKSIKSGIFTSIKTSTGYSYVSPFAIAINSSDAMVSLLSSFTGLLGPISQVWGSKIMRKHSRKKIVSKAVLLEALLWIPFIILSYLYYKNILTSFLPVLLLFAFSIYTIANHIGHPAWFSWMGDLVNPKNRGKFFAKRNLLIGFISVVATIGAAVFLDYMKKTNLQMFGFAVLFGVALLTRLISWRTWATQYEPKLEKPKKERSETFLHFLKNAPKNNFGRFSLFRGFMAFAISISSPLVAVYLLRYLEFDYVTYMIITMAGTIFSLLFLEIWGMLADIYGNYRVVCLTAIMIPIVPLLWLFSPNPLYLALVPSALGGIFWAAFTLASGNLIYDNTNNEERAEKLSYFNLLIGIGVFFGAGLGALLIDLIDTQFIEPLFVVFIIGTIFRMATVFYWLPKINEITKKKNFKNIRELEHVFIKQVKPTLIEEAHEITSIDKYLKLK